MNSDEATLARLISFLSASVSVKEKIRIRTAYEPAQELAGETRLGDDCAAIRDGDGWLLLAAEGMLPSFVADDPWFAGYSAVMVNLSDVSAMGGRPTGDRRCALGSRSRPVRANLGGHERGFEGVRRTDCRRAHDGDQGRLPVSRRGGFGKGKTFDDKF